MPQVGCSAGSDDLASSDETKVFDDEGEKEEENRAINDLNELKSSLITEGEQANKMPMVGGPHAGSPMPFMMPNLNAFPQPPPAHMGIPPVHIHPKTGIPRPPMYPLPGHGQYSHSVFPDFANQFQWHTPAMYPMAPGPFRGPYPSLSSVPTSIFSAFPRAPLIPPHHPAHSVLSGHPGLTHQALTHLAASAGSKQHQDLAAAVSAASAAGLANHHCHQCTEGHNGHSSLELPMCNSKHSLPSYQSSNHHNVDQKPSLSRVSNGSSSGATGASNGGPRSPPNSTSSANHSMSSPGTPESFNGKTPKSHKESNKPHVKKPLNSFMLYMKEMRPKVVAECTLKESAAINQILGRRWHALSREEQAKYYDMARKERQLHMQLYPGWTARDNYASNAKKKKKKRDKNSDGEGGALKKCRARFGLDQQNNWCKPCRRKKKCIRYLDSGDTAGESEDNIGSVDSIEAPTPDSKSANESDTDNLNLSSAELSLSSPPTVPNSDYPLIPHHNNHSNHSLVHSFHSDINSRVQMTSSTQSCPPRNSPFSIEQLARPHCPQVRSSSSSSSISVTSINNRSKTPNTTQTSDSIPQLPTPPSSESSPAMLSVA